MSASRPKRKAAMKHEDSAHEYEKQRKQTKAEKDYEKKHDERAARKGRGLMRSNTVFEYAGHPETRETEKNPFGVLVGKRVEVWWPTEKDWFAGRVTEYDAFNGHSTVKYDDGEVVIHNLNRMKYRFEGQTKAEPSHLKSDGDAMDESADDGAAPADNGDAAAADDGAAADGEPSAKRARVTKATPKGGDHVVVPMHAGGVPPPPVVAVIESDQGSKAVVDPACGLDGHVYEQDGVPCEATMAKVDIAQNMDKFYVVQVVEDEAQSKYWAVNHWGRTGTKGQVKVEGPMAKEDALKLVAEKFEEKTGVAWENRTTAAAVAGKYVFKKKVYNTDAPKRVMWQYYVDDFVDGKQTGWYNYEEVAARTVEGVFSEWKFNDWLDIRSVHSGYWDYCVDFNTMTQTNIKTKKQRKIQRVDCK